MKTSRIRREIEQLVAGELWPKMYRPLYWPARPLKGLQNKGKSSFGIDIYIFTLLFPWPRSGPPLFNSRIGTAAEVFYVWN